MVHRMRSKTGAGNLNVPTLRSCENFSKSLVARIDMSPIKTNAGVGELSIDQTLRDDAPLDHALLDLEHFLPYRLSVLSNRDRKSVV